MLIYSLNENGNIEKYNISYDKTQLLFLRRVIVKNCTLREISIIKTVVPEIYESKNNAKVISKKKAGLKEYKGYDSSLPLYEITLEEYTYPKLIDIIDKLLNGNIEGYFELRKYVDTREFPEDRIKRISEDINKIGNDKIDEKKSKLDELSKAIEFAKINTKVMNANASAREVLNSIKCTLVDTMSVEEINRIKTFFGENFEEEYLLKMCQRKKNK